ncbi:sigma-70 family RNA polymerase sigma factor [Halobacillus litoralis]|uniref:sigma-70 family RNA polymerase sigma factor n=1 Tax=Halobacillus litoralis TaxID=45668 RepID=UPI00249291BD|nr:sigma-70 family RNA polymerase sigma factor [Halobacillus litoralis]
MQEKKLNKNTDKEILIELMGNYGDMVLRIAFTYVKEQQLAEDLAQDIFIRCYQKLHTFEERSSYRTWLYRITVNHCKDYVGSWSFKNLIPAEYFNSEKTYEDVSEQVIENEQNKLLFQKVLKLSVKLREVVIFYYYEELTIEEIADLLNIKENTVKTRLYRARKNLKKVLKGGEVFE